MNEHRLADRARDPRAAGIAMTVATAAALLWANVASDNYRDVWHHVFSVAGLHLTAQDWTNQLLMVAFFVLVGLEIRREISGGELRSLRHAAVPVGAALGGMAIPALVYALVLHGGDGAHGWGIPMATDVAFAISALALLATHASTRLRVFLLTLAVADDIASIAILVLFYSRGVHVGDLAVAVVALVLLFVVHRRPGRPTAVLMVLAAVAWWALVHAGVEASVVGVAVGLVAAAPASGDPSARRVERQRSRAWEHALEPWVNVVVLPVFALANVGVTFSGSGILSGAALTVLVAVVLARVIGKPMGIAGTAWILTRGGGGRDLMHLHARDRLGLGSLAAVGFTVPLLIVRAALPAGPLAAAAITGLLVGSVIGAVGGAVVLRPTDRDAR